MYNGGMDCEMVEREREHSFCETPSVIIDNKLHKQQTTKKAISTIIFANSIQVKMVCIPEFQVLWHDSLL